MPNTNQPEGCVTPAVHAAIKKNLVGTATSDLVGFYGTTAVSQRAAAILTATNSVFATTGASYVAQTTATVSGLFGFNSVYVSNLLDAIIELRALVVALGLHKGGA